MNLSNYIVKKTGEEYSILGITDQNSVPLGNCEIVKAEYFDNAKLVVAEDGELSIVEDTATRDITTAYDAMVEDVYNEMEGVFNTRNDISATAFAATYEAMLKRPENYVSLELGLYDVAAVTAYATSKIADADAYGVYRLTRITQFTAEKAAILEG